MLLQEMLLALPVSAVLVTMVIFRGVLTDCIVNSVPFTKRSHSASPPTLFRISPPCTSSLNFVCTIVDVVGMKVLSTVPRSKLHFPSTDKLGAEVGDPEGTPVGTPVG